MRRIEKNKKRSDESGYVSSDSDRSSELSGEQDCSENDGDFEMSDSDPDFLPQSYARESGDDSETEGSDESKFVKSQLQKI